MSDLYREKLETSLPDLPEGYYWRIKKRESAVYPLRVVIMKRMPWWRFDQGILAQITEAEITAVIQAANNLKGDFAYRKTPASLAQELTGVYKK